ncbi:unnamed protein product, partial [Candidula unifasciata]
MPKRGKHGIKGKRGYKPAKDNMESALKLAAASSKIWETKLDIASKSKQEFRECATKLIIENDVLHAQMFQNERETIDVITYLKKQDEDKDDQ